LKPSSCKFCQIVSGDVSAHLVLEDEVSIAFLDHRPVFPGHCLLITRKHYETLADLPEKLLKPFFQNAQLLAQAVELGLEAQGSFVGINNRVSQSVPHLHVHVVPRRQKDGLKGFFWPRHPYQDDQQAVDAQEAIQRAIREIRK